MREWSPSNRIGENLQMQIMAQNAQSVKCNEWLKISGQLEKLAENFSWKR